MFIEDNLHTGLVLRILLPRLGLRDNYWPKMYTHSHVCIDTNKSTKVIHWHLVAEMLHRINFSTIPSSESSSVIHHGTECFLFLDRSADSGITFWFCSFPSESSESDWIKGEPIGCYYLLLLHFYESAMLKHVYCHWF